MDVVSAEIRFTMGACHILALQLAKLIGDEGCYLIVLPGNGGHACVMSNDGTMAYDIIGEHEVEELQDEWDTFDHDMQVYENTPRGREKFFFATCGYCEDIEDEASFDDEVIFWANYLYMKHFKKELCHA